MPTSRKAGTWVLLASQWAAEQVKATKAAKAARKVRTVTFICPNPECGETSTSEVDNGAVTCDACEVVLDVNAVKLVRAGKAAA